MKAAISRCGLTSLTIPGGVTEIGKAAFEQCAFLTSAAIFADVEELPEDLFDGCTRLKSMALPSGLRRIGQVAFTRCPALETIQLPDGLTHIGVSAFSHSGVTNGTSDTTFTPDKVCTCAQVVSILFRANGRGLLSLM